MNKTNPVVRAVARRACREENPQRLAELLMDIFMTRPTQFGQLVRDALVDGPERRGTDARPGSPRQARRAG